MVRVLTYYQQSQKKVPGNVKSIYGDFTTHLEMLEVVPDVLYYDCCGHPDHATIKKMFAMVGKKTKCIVAVTWCLRNMSKGRQQELEKVLKVASVGFKTSNYKQSNSPMVTRFYYVN